MSVAETEPVEEMTIHSAAEAFPMLPDDELKALAASIKKIGLINPIMLSTDGRQLIAGRNRLRACEIAGVEPRYDWLPQGMDPRDYIVAENINRRDMTKGQKALALAIIYPEPAKRGRGNKNPALKSEDSSDFTDRLLRYARVIARHADLADMVKAGTMKFDMALEEAQTRARIEDNSAFYMKELRAHAPDLAAQVADEGMTLQEAWGTFDIRKREAELVEKQKRAACLTALSGFFGSTTSSDNAEFLQGLEERLKDPEFEAEVHRQLRLDTIDHGEARLAMINGTKALTAIMQALL